METDFDFKKLYAKPDGDFEKGTSYTFIIENKWTGHEWDAGKRIFISEINLLGGNNPWMGIYFLIAGGLTLGALIVYEALYFIVVKPKNEKAKKDKRK